MAFREEAYSIARYFDKTGDHQLAEYIMSLLSNANTFMPQTTLDDMIFFRKLDVSNSSLFLPNQIKKDIIGIINAIGHNLGVNKFFYLKGLQELENRICKAISKNIRKRTAFC